VVVDRSHAFSDGFNLTGITDNLTSARTESYGYTAANRLNSAGGIWASLAWSYDGVGNRSSEALTSGSTTTWTYAYPGGNNKLSTVTQGSNVRTFTHDAAGNVTADDRVGTTYNYRYNNRARLDRLTIGSTVTADYTYDGLERLALRVTQNMTPAGTTHYVYDRQGHLIVEADSSGNTLREYVWLDDTPLAVVADVDTVSPKLWFVHADHLDRPLKMTDGTQAVVWDAVYRPFGEVVSISGSASNNLRFPGQYFLIESGLHYNWYRHYDPTIGRYLQADPLEFVDGPSRYAYVGSLPTLGADPAGLTDITKRQRGQIDAPFSGRPGEGGGSGPMCPIPGGVSASTSPGSKWWQYRGPPGDGLSNFKDYVGGKYVDKGGGVYTGIGRNGENVTYYPTATSTGGPTIQITPPGGLEGGMSGYKVRY
jgi:RHS repeat-associated protein